MSAQIEQIGLAVLQGKGAKRWPRTTESSRADLLRSYPAEAINPQGIDASKIAACLYHNSFKDFPGKRGAAQRSPFDFGLNHEGTIQRLVVILKIDNLRQLDVIPMQLSERGNFRRKVSRWVRQNPQIIGPALREKPVDIGRDSRPYSFYPRIRCGKEALHNVLNLLLCMFILQVRGM